MPGFLLRDGKLVYKNSKIVYASEPTSECCCQGEEADGEPCEHCQEATTWEVFRILFAGIADGNCVGNAAYYNDEFRFSQDIDSPCFYNFDQPTPDVWGGPCGLGPTHMTITATYIEIDISEVGGAVFLRAPHTAGNSCAGPHNFTFHHRVGAPVLNLTWEACTAVATHS